MTEYEKSTSLFISESSSSSESAPSSSSKIYASGFIPSGSEDYYFYDYSYYYDYVSECDDMDVCFDDVSTGVLGKFPDDAFVNDD